ncbi:MAG: AAA family ATPase, partial [Planctomycetaceae bacterium]|nr:AAA family ATPase [Planctomycetaceae bacterium]
MTQWKIFHGDGRRPHDALETIRNQMPPWRDFSKENPQETHRGRTYIPGPAEVEMVNAAIHLRRPLLVTGDPGVGKSSLAFAVARELNLLPVLKWPINSRSTLQEGLYEYDAIARLRDANLERLQAQSENSGGKSDSGRKQTGGSGKQRTLPSEDIGRYLTLGPLGTAFADSSPRVVLIDEIDKAESDVPNGLLGALGSAEFTPQGFSKAVTIT